jgi:hypothetical protein
VPAITKYSRPASSLFLLLFLYRVLLHHKVRTTLLSLSSIMSKNLLLLVKS